MSNPVSGIHVHKKSSKDQIKTKACGTEASIESPKWGAYTQYLRNYLVLYKMNSYSLF